MSHFSVCKIKIRNPNIELLKLAARELAKELNGEIVSRITDYYGKTETDFVIAVKTPSMPQGVGIRVKNGQVELVGDFWATGMAKTQLEATLTKIYTSLAVAKTLQGLGYSVNIQKEKEKVLLYARN